METDIQIFRSETFGEIRTCQVNNQIMFAGKDVAMALGVIYWQSGQYMLYADYAREKLAKSRTHCRHTKMGKVRTEVYLVWTEEGRNFLHDIFKNSNL